MVIAGDYLRFCFWGSALVFVLFCLGVPVDMLVVMIPFVNILLLLGLVNVFYWFALFVVRLVDVDFVC